MSITFSPLTVFCSNRLIGQSAVQSRMKLVGLQANQGLSFGERLLKLLAAFSPSAVYTALGRGGCVACTCCNVILPAAKSGDMLFGIIEPLPPLGGTVSTSCSTAQSPLMFGWPSARRNGRFEVSTALVWNWSLRLIRGASPSLKVSM